MRADFLTCQIPTGLEAISSIAYRESTAGAWRKHYFGSINNEQFCDEVDDKYALGDANDLPKQLQQVGKCAQIHNSQAAEMRRKRHSLTLCCDKTSLLW
jgi:hypothetical protein